MLQENTGYQQPPQRNKGRVSALLPAKQIKWPNAILPSTDPPSFIPQAVLIVDRPVLLSCGPRQSCLRSSLRLCPHPWDLRSLQAEKRLWLSFVGTDNCLSEMQRNLTSQATLQASWARLVTPTGPAARGLLFDIKFNHRFMEEALIKAMFPF